MRIAIAIASRGRPSALAGVIMSAWRLQSGRHELCFVLGTDDDDKDTADMIDLLQADAREALPIVAFPAPRASLLGTVQNRIFAAAQGSEVVTLMTDRTYIISPGWDDGIAVAATQCPDRVIWWSSPVDTDLTIPIIPAAYAEALEWKWSPGVFPFWWDDTWHAEIDGMAAGGPSVRTQAAYAGQRATTTRAREFDFWTRVFIALRPRRIEKAKEICDRLGKEWKDPPAEMLEHFAARDKFQLEHAPLFEQRFGDKSPPDDAYFAAKAAAEEILKEMGQ